MPPLRPMEEIGDEALALSLTGVPDAYYVVWTGGAYGAVAGSLRSEGLKVITEVGVPVKLRDVLRRAARIDGKKGYDPGTLRSGIRLHQGAKPAVYLLLEKGSDGHFRTVTDIPNPGLGTVQLPAGTVLNLSQFPKPPR